MSAARPPSALRIALRPGLLLLHLTGVAAIVVCVVMGLWQLGVYDARQASERADRQQVPVVDLDEALGPDEAFTNTANHRPVRVTGTFGTADEQRWVAGRELGDRDGYWLLAPVVTGDRGQDGRPTALVVVRGWSAAAGSPPPPPAGPVELRAVLEPGEARSTAGEPPRGDVLDAVRLPLLANELPYDLYSGYGLVTDPPPGDGLSPVPPPEPGTSWTTGLQNLAYALQWWVFGAFAVFMWWRIARDVVARERALDDAAWYDELTTPADAGAPDDVEARADAPR